MGGCLAVTTSRLHAPEVFLQAPLPCCHVQDQLLGVLTQKARAKFCIYRSWPNLAPHLRFNAEGMTNIGASAKMLTEAGKLLDSTKSEELNSDKQYRGV